MKALYFESHLSLREVEMARPEPDEALIRVSLAGICGTDRQILKGYSGFRGIPGHEFVGEVAACDQARWVGRRVVGEINVACERCEWCRRGLARHCAQRTVMGIVNRPGTFAEFIALPVVNLHEVPPRVPDEAAVFTEPLAAAAEILEQMTIPAGTNVAVLGDGRLGLLVAQVLAQAGAMITIIGRTAWKLDLACSWGLNTVLVETSNASPADMAADAPRLTVPGAGELPSKSFPIVVEATGSPGGLEEALRLVAPRGTVVMKSTFHQPARFDTAKLVVDEVTLLGSRCGNFQTALELLSNGAVHVTELISKIFPLDAAVEAFEYVDNTSCLKVLLTNGRKH